MTTIPNQTIPALRVTTIAAGLTAIATGAWVILGDGTQVGTVGEIAGAIALLGAISLAVHQRKNQ